VGRWRSGQSGVTNSLDARAMVAGYPAIDSREWRKASVLFKRLPELKRRIEALEQQIARLVPPILISSRKVSE
jgi:UDP-3-O-[3-hydroxymyristoyl] glucosamine N-acyltransferase